MRISYWSSDVCSSDLQHRTAAQQNGKDQAAKDDGDGPIFRTDTRLRQLGLRVLHLIVLKHLQALQEGAHAIRRLVFLDQLCAPPGRSGCDARLQLLAPRSEEHTSELQSLMRLSYAV